MADEEIVQDQTEAPAKADLEGAQVELMKVFMNGEDFLIPVHDVSEILKPVAVTPVPMAPDHILGVSNIRGQIVCIVDPGKVLHLKEERQPQGENTRYVILRHPRMHLGIWVDSVTELFRISKEEMPEFDEESRGYVRGEMEINGNSFKILNTEVLFD